MVKNHENVQLAMFIVWAIFQVFGFKIGMFATIAILQSIAAGKEGP